MKKNGFTLVEVLVVIVIIAVLSTIISPIVINLLSKNRQEMYENQVRTLEEASKRWSVDHAGELSSDESSYCLSLDELSNEGYISGSDLKNPVNDEDLVGSILITYNSVYQQYEFKFVETLCSE